MFDGQDLLKLDDDEMRKIRGNRISMIFQQPTSSLNPVMQTSATRSARCFGAHRGMKKKAARETRARADAHGRHSRSRSAGSTLIRTRCRAAWPSA